MTMYVCYAVVIFTQVAAPFKTVPSEGQRCNLIHLTKKKKGSDKSMKDKEIISP